MWVIHSSLTQCVNVCIQGKLDHNISTLMKAGKALMPSIDMKTLYLSLTHVTVKHQVKVTNNTQSDYRLAGNFRMVEIFLAQ